MKIKLKTLADKITAVALYLICMTIVISLFLEVSYMADVVSMINFSSPKAQLPD